MATLKNSTVLRNVLANAVRTAIDSGAGAGGTIKIYSGSMPATPQDAPGGSNTLLATLTFQKPSFGTAATGAITANTIAQAAAVAAGTAAWARIADCDGNALMDVDVNTSGATINLTSLTLAAGDIMAISSATITIPQ